MMQRNNVWSFGIMVCFLTAVSGYGMEQDCLADTKCAAALQADLFLTVSQETTKKEQESAESASKEQYDPIVDWCALMRTDDFAQPGASYQGGPIVDDLRKIMSEYQEAVDMHMPVPEKTNIIDTLLKKATERFKKRPIE